MGTLESSTTFSREGIPTASPSSLTSFTRFESVSKSWTKAILTLSSVSLRQILASLKSNPSSGTSGQIRIGGKQWRGQSAKPRVTRRQQNRSPSLNRTTLRNERQCPKRQDWTMSVSCRHLETFRQRPIYLSSLPWALPHPTPPPPPSRSQADTT